MAARRSSAIVAKSGDGQAWPSAPESSGWPTVRLDRHHRQLPGGAALFVTPVLRRCPQRVRMNETV